MTRPNNDPPVYGLVREPIEPAALCGEFPDTVEVIHDRALAELAAFLRQRRGYYDTIWITRTPNLDLLRPLLEAGGVDVLGGVNVVLDSEAIAARREAARAGARDCDPAAWESALARILDRPRRAAVAHGPCTLRA